MMKDNEKLTLNNLTKKLKTIKETDDIQKLQEFAEKIFRELLPNAGRFEAKPNEKQNRPTFDENELYKVFDIVVKAEKWDLLLLLIPHRCHDDVNEHAQGRTIRLYAKYSTHIVTAIKNKKIQKDILKENNKTLFSMLKDGVKIKTEYQHLVTDNVKSNNKKGPWTIRNPWELNVEAIKTILEHTQCGHNPIISKKELKNSNYKKESKEKRQIEKITLSEAEDKTNKKYHIIEILFQHSNLKDNDDEEIIREPEENWNGYFANNFESENKPDLEENTNEIFVDDVDYGSDDVDSDSDEEEVPKKQIEENFKNFNQILPKEECHYVELSNFAKWPLTKQDKLEFEHGYKFKYDDEANKVHAVFCIRKNKHTDKIIQDKILPIIKQIGGTNHFYEKIKKTLNNKTTSDSDNQLKKTQKRNHEQNPNKNKPILKSLSDLENNLKKFVDDGKKQLEYIKSLNEQSLRETLKDNAYEFKSILELLNENLHEKFLELLGKDTIKNLKFKNVYGFESTLKLLNENLHEKFLELLGEDTIKSLKFKDEGDNKDTISTARFTVVLKELNEKQHKKFIELLGDSKLKTIIGNIDQLTVFINNLNKDGGQEKLKNLIVSLGNIIKKIIEDANSLKHILRQLNKNQHDELIKLLGQNKIQEIIKSTKQLKDIKSVFHGNKNAFTLIEDRLKLKHRIKKNPIKKINALKKILINTHKKNHKILIELLGQKKIQSIIKNADQLALVLNKFNEEQYKSLQNISKSIIKNSTDLVCVLENVNTYDKNRHEKLIELLGKDKIQGIIKDYHNLIDTLEQLNKDQHGELIKLLGKDKIQEIIEDDLDLENILEALNKAQRVELIKLLGKEKIQEIIKDERSLIAILKLLNKDQQVELIKLLSQEKIQNIINYPADINGILKALNKTQQVELIKLLGNKFQKIVTKESKLKNILEKLGNNQQVELMEFLGCEIKNIVKNNNQLMTIRKTLLKEQNANNKPDVKKIDDICFNLFYFTESDNFRKILPKYNNNDKKLENLDFLSWKLREEDIIPDYNNSDRTTKEFHMWLLELINPKKTQELKKEQEQNLNHFLEILADIGAINHGNLWSLINKLDKALNDCINYPTFWDKVSFWNQSTTITIKPGKKTELTNILKQRDIIKELIKNHGEKILDKKKTQNKINNSVKGKNHLLRLKQNQDESLSLGETEILTLMQLCAANTKKEKTFFNFVNS